jgi:hypothetical protein
MPEYATHKVVKTKVVQLKGDVYAVTFTYDDGAEETAGVGSKETAEWYARAQKGETFPVGIHPLRLNAEKAQKLRR